MSNETELNKADDEISLLDLMAVLWRRRVMIIVITVIGAVGAVVFSIISLVLPPDKSPLPNQYTPEALMLINDTSSSGGGLSSMLSSSGLGSLASLAGVNVPASSNPSELASYLVGTNNLLDAVVDEFGLIERYEIKIEKSPRAKSRKILKKLLEAESDEKSGVFSVRFTDRDPEFAQRVVNYCVAYLEKRFEELGVDKNKIEEANLRTSIANTFQEIVNLEQETQRLGRTLAEGAVAGRLPAITIDINRLQLELKAQQEVYTQLKVQHELLKVTMAGERPVFQILELAEVPDQKSKPGRGLLCVIVTFGAGFMSVFLAFVLNAIENIRKDPEAMAKLHGEKDPGR